MYNKQHKKYKIINKFRFYLFVTSLLIFMFIVFYSFKADAEGLSKVEVEAVYIETGDTLWSISEKFAGNKMDIRKHVDKIIEYNNLKSSTIKPGQLIYVPVYNQ